MSVDGKAGGAERRIHQRSPIMLKVTYKTATDFLAAYTENISVGGLFIATEEHITKGSKLDFEISFPGLLDPIPLTGIVKWVRPNLSQQEPAGIGVQFLMDTGRAIDGPLGILINHASNGDAQATDESLVMFRVLLVEDNVVVRDMFRYGIQKLSRQKRLPISSIEVDEVSNGAEAWDLLQKKTYHLVVLDLYMPVMDGSQLIQRIRADAGLKTIPIIVVSAGGAEDRKQAMALGADIFLSKPIKLKEMLETVEKLISLGHRPKGD